jgi:FkbM family methyltransferase
MKKSFERFIINQIPNLRFLHKRESFGFKFIETIVNSYFKKIEEEHNGVDTVPYNNGGKLYWPKIKLGNLDSYCWFELSEMILHYYYYVNKHNYKNALDIGSNVGIDAILMEKNGFNTHAFEPDPDLFNQMEKNLKLNFCKNLKVFNKGVSDKKETLSFIKVLGNENANHIEGTRSFYGDYKRIKVEVIPFSEINLQPDLMKINVEGHEKIIVPTIPVHVWEKADTFIEVHDKENAEVLWNFFNKININVFSQKKRWGIAKNLYDIPFTNKEGYIFVTKKNKMNW